MTRGIGGYWFRRVTAAVLVALVLAALRATGVLGATDGNCPGPYDVEFATGEVIEVGSYSEVQLAPDAVSEARGDTFDYCASLEAGHGGWTIEVMCDGNVVEGSSFGSGTDAWGGGGNWSEGTWGFPACDELKVRVAPQDGTSTLASGGLRVIAGAEPTPTPTAPPEATPTPTAAGLSCTADDPCSVVLTACTGGCLAVVDEAREAARTSVAVGTVAAGIGVFLLAVIAVTVAFRRM